MLNRASSLARRLEDHQADIDRRACRRKATSFDSLTFQDPRFPADVKVLDVSTGGCRLESKNGDFRPDQCVTFALSNRVVVEGVIRWAKDGAFGVEFLTPISDDLVASVA